MNNLAKNKILWFVTAVLTIGASLTGIFRPGIYDRVIVESLLPGAVGQDVISLISGVLLVLFVFLTKSGQFKKQVIVLGILGYLFYAYGIYVIEQVYNQLYLIYMAIWTLSFWGIISGAVSIRKEIVSGLVITNGVRNFSIAVSLMQPLVFYPLWISALLPLLREQNRIENLFSVYIIDLCLIMPAFLILAGLLYKRNNYSFLLTPALFILGFTIIFSLTVSELMKWQFNSSPSGVGVVQSGILSALFLSATAVHLAKVNSRKLPGGKIV